MKVAAGFSVAVAVGVKDGVAVITGIAVEVVFGFDVAVGSFGISVMAAAGVSVMFLTSPSLVAATNPGSKVTWVVQTETVESRGGKVGIAPQEVSTSVAKPIRMINVLFLIKLSLFGSTIDPIRLTSLYKCKFLAIS